MRILDTSQSSYDQQQEVISQYLKIKQCNINHSDQAAVREVVTSKKDELADKSSLAVTSSSSSSLVPSNSNAGAASALLNEQFQATSSLSSLSSLTNTSTSNQHLMPSNLLNTSTSNLNNSRAIKFLADYKQIDLELRAQNFDVIRFATYRTASKLRFIQKKLNLHLIDLWNVIETFRDNNLQTLDISYELDIDKIETCIKSMYLQLNKRLALNQHIHVESQTQLLTAWLLNLYDKTNLASIKVLAFKTALTTMCSGKLIDKIKFIFTQISDSNKNSLIFAKFDMCLRHLLQIPTSVYEEPSFGYRESLAKSCFDWTTPIRLEEFITVVLSDSGPPCFIWLNIFHRFTIVQSVEHPVRCVICQKTNFNGFRYKCQKCRKYQLCQDCFWRGRVSNSHQLTHQMKEYTSYKSAAKQFSNSIRRSFFCKPSRQSLSKQTMQQSMPQKRFISQPPMSSSSANNDKSPINRHQHEYNNEPSSNSMTAASITQSMNTANNEQPSILITNGVSCDAVSSNHINGQEDQSNYNTLTNSVSHTDPTGANANAIQSKKLSPSNNDEEVYFFTPNGSTKSTSTSTRLHKQTQHQQQQPPQLNSFDNISTTPDHLARQQQLKTMLDGSSKSPSTCKHSNTFSLTRNKPCSDTMTSIPNLLTNYVLNNTNNSMNLILNSTQQTCSLNGAGQHQSSNPGSTDEHNMISNYASKLADFYSKNPHLSTSPATTPVHGTCRLNSSGYLLPALSHINYTLSAASQKTSQSKSYQTLKSNLKSRTIDRTGLGYFNGGTMLGSDLAGSPVITPTHVMFDDNDNRTASLSRRAQAMSGMNSKNQRLINELMLKQQQQRMEYSTNARSMSANNFASNDEIYASINVKPNQAKDLREKREMVAKLEQQNRDILKEIRRLRNVQMMSNSFRQKGESNYESLTYQRPAAFEHIAAELNTLKNRRGQLESRIQQLQNIRNELIVQLDGLVKQQHPASSSVLNKTRNDSRQPYQQSIASLIPNISASMAMPLNHPRSWSTPSTPAMHELHPHNRNNPASTFNQPSSMSLLSNSGSNGRMSSSSPTSSATNSTRNLRNDLLLAADSVTNAMQSLVKELNSESNGFQNEGSCTSDDNDVDPDIDDDVQMLRERQVPNGTSLSASCTPVVFRRQQQPLPTQYRNGVIHSETNHGTYSISNRVANDEFDDIDDIYLVNTNSSTNSNESKPTSRTNENDCAIGTQQCDANNTEANYGDQELNENEDDDIDENYLLNDSFIDNLNMSSMFGQQVQHVPSNQRIMTSAYASLQDEDKQKELLQEQYEYQNNMFMATSMMNATKITACDIGGMSSESNDLVASWRRELEQCFESETNDQQQQQSSMLSQQQQQQQNQQYSDDDDDDVATSGEDEKLMNNAAENRQDENGTYAQAEKNYDENNNSNDEELIDLK